MFTVQCDFCLTGADGGEWTAAQARERAREEGFHQRGQVAICPDCWAAGRRYADNPYGIELPKASA